MSDIRDRVRGILLGLAAGDRIGGPVRMALCLGESLVERQRFDEGDILARYLAWWRAGGFDTGPVASEVFHLLDAGGAADDAVRQVHLAYGGMTAGCNPAHRSPPLAMAAFLDDDALGDLARREARLTHHHAIAGEVSACGVMLCRRLVRGVPWSEARPECARELSRGGFALDVWTAAVHFVEEQSSFSDALEAAIRFAGAANYCPVLAGVIAGARWGASRVPIASVDAVVRERVVAVADALAAGWR